MKKNATVIVVGGGISGLAAAWWLHKAGVNVTLLEREKEVGGTMQSVTEDGWLVEQGPNSALETTPLFQSLFQDLNISDQVVYTNEQSKYRYILRDGLLHQLPLSAGSFVSSGLWTLSGKLRLFREPFVGRADRHETVAEFVSRRLGREFLDYAINPFVAGVYAGNPEELSVRAAFPKLYALEERYGGLVKGQIFGGRERKKRAEQSKDRARMFAMKNGMQALPQAISAALGSRVVRSAAVSEIRKVKSGAKAMFEVRGKRSGRNFASPADAVVTALPAFVTSDLVSRLDPQLASSLGDIPYPPVAEVFLGFRSSDIKKNLDGFGFLVPGLEQRKILGTIWSSSLFPGRAPHGFTALTTFVGGSRQPGLTGLRDAELVTMVTEELRDIMGVAGKPAFVRIARWSRAIPQYTLRHGEAMAVVERFEDRHPGLFLSGNWRGGIAVGDCLMSSERIVSRVRAAISGTRQRTQKD